MAIGGTADTTAPLSLTEQAVNNMAGTRFVISQPGVEHGLESENVPEVFTWAIVFLDAHLKDTATRRQARTRLARMQRVIGGTDESVNVDVLLPAAPLPGETLVQEFYNVHLDHYFITPYTAEADNIILNGSAGPGWDRTQHQLQCLAGQWPPPAFRSAVSTGRRARDRTRISSPPMPASARASRRIRAGRSKGLTMRVILTSDGVCPLDSRPVYRAVQQPIREERLEPPIPHEPIDGRDEMKGQGWLYEGTVFCAVP